VVTSSIASTVVLLEKGGSLANEITGDKRYVTVDGDEIDTSRLSQHGRAQLTNLEFVNEQLTLKNNELQIADSARVVYSSVFKSELKKIKLKK
jgi:hypothetical protein